MSALAVPVKVAALWALAAALPAEAFPALTAAETGAAGAGIEPLWLAHFIDFAAIELGALFLVADDFVGLADLLEAFHRLGIVGVGVRMMLLGERAESLLDLGFAGLLRHAKDFIWIARHISPELSLEGLI